MLRTLKERRERFRLSAPNARTAQVRPSRASWRAAVQNVGRHPVASSGQEVTGAAPMMAPQSAAISPGGSPLKQPFAACLQHRRPKLRSAGQLVLDSIRTDAGRFSGRCCVFLLPSAASAGGEVYGSMRCSVGSGFRVSRPKRPPSREARAQNPYSCLRQRHRIVSPGREQLEPYDLGILTAVLAVAILRHQRCSGRAVPRAIRSRSTNAWILTFDSTTSRQVISR